MVEPREATHTATLRDACRATHADTFGLAAQAVTQRRWRRTLEPIRLLRERAEMLHQAVVHDALQAGLDWWQVADHLNMHPQDVWELCRGTAERLGIASPADQRPDLAMKLCAGADVIHEFDPAYGADLDDLPATHSLHHDPTVLRLREASVLLVTDIWIAITPPGEPTPSIEPGAVAVAWSGVATSHTEIDAVHQALQARRAQVHCYCLPTERPYRAPA
ncbi:hypothetical protein [Allorhizocola rhizosphaerae]|uniref:hypothetical protein n=1 Tax=Allorhizocola rhizosphaerae TaxID=1872709 RepID=UPI000E3EB6C4|nr:hypothetical protein [Allorhizocola rhizosphaerae]